MNTTSSNSIFRTIKFYFSTKFIFTSSSNFNLLNFIKKILQLNSFKMNMRKYNFIKTNNSTFSTKFNKFIRNKTWHFRIKLCNKFICYPTTGVTQTINFVRTTNSISKSNFIYFHSYHFTYYKYIVKIIMYHFWNILFYNISIKWTYNFI